jgi:hypothetical protein
LRNSASFVASGSSVWRSRKSTARPMSMIWKTSPVYLDPLVFNGVLVTPGFCYDCLANPKLPASTRMYQFKSKPKWQSHIQTHRCTGRKACKMRAPNTTVFCYLRFPFGASVPSSRRSWYPLT